VAWEIELKLRVASHDDIRQRLRDSGAHFASKVLEQNDIFDRRDDTLRTSGVGLRVRSTRDADNSTRIDESAPATLTVKGPREPGVLKSREEVEFAVPNAEIAARMLNLLGFVRVLRYEKRRESWRFGGCLVELDEPPHLGRFVEIEGPDEATINTVRTELGLSQAEPVADSYVRLMMNYCAAHGLNERVVTIA